MPRRLSIREYVRSKTWSVRRAASGFVFGRRSSPTTANFQSNWLNECALTNCLRRFGKLEEINIRKRQPRGYFNKKQKVLDSIFGLKLHLEVTGFMIHHSETAYFDNIYSKDLRTLRLEHLKKNPLTSGAYFDEHSANIYFGREEHRELVGTLNEFYTAPPPGNSFTLCLTNGDIYRFEYEENGGCAVYKDKYSEAIMIAEFHGIYTDFNLNYRILWTTKVIIPIKVLLILCLFAIHEKFYSGGLDLDILDTDAIRQHQKERLIHFH